MEHRFDIYDISIASTLVCMSQLRRILRLTEYTYRLYCKTPRVSTIYYTREWFADIHSLYTLLQRFQPSSNVIEIR